jgi:L-seryl-tRNA(Ser) seleniumtransferase
MLGVSPEALEKRAERLAHGLAERVAGLLAKVMAGEGEVGGGSLPLQKLPGPVVVLGHPWLSAAELESRARAAEPPVIGTVRAGSFRLDPRTLADDEIELVTLALANAWGGRNEA